MDVIRGSFLKDKLPTVKLKRHELKCLRHHHVINKHAVDHVTNLNLLSGNDNAHSESVREIIKTLVPCWCNRIYTKQLPLITKRDPKDVLRKKFV